MTSAFFFLSDLFLIIFSFVVSDLEMPSGRSQHAWSMDKDLDLQNSKLYI